ncbi:hypothetical protein JJB67_11405 [Clostridium perfringens]|uniref:Uncharacterized protein n=1 Tax=Clostridium perfringens TaxID=1502 RepID=A0A2W6N4A2_CLOPF|nr:hypothetical protein [Clostridium perfringens]ASY52798.1 hypothetical protein BG908_14520 [Clostridium perfringens]AWS24384.1 hypothetical protein CYK96_01660 [Clostridium perfringens]MBO3304279.1 hypothetical protein [Clostridium perfringens]MBO3307599.1 hypothetical protein [Clostridium perfringens]MBO3309861.1 hypothetical protein [Clostridium perfringens]
MTQLDNIIKESGYKLNKILSELNISRSTFWRIRKGLRPLKENEIIKLSEIINVPEKKIKEMIS